MKAGDEVSLEREELGAGLFATAVADGLLGKADTFKDKMVFTKELDSYVTNQVRDWSNGEQLPVYARPAIADFPLTRTP